MPQKAKMAPEYKKNDASALFLREWIKTSDCIRMRQKTSDRPPQPEKAEAGGPFLSFVFWKFWRLTIHARLSIIKIRKGAGCTVVSSLSQCHILRNMTAGVWKTIGAVIFLAILFFDIVFCMMHIPKKDLGNRPSDFGSAKDDSGQKAEQSNNSIQNFHSGILP